MDIKKLRDLFTKLVYQDTLNLNDVGVRSVLQDLVGDEINRLREVKKNEHVIVDYYESSMRVLRRDE